MLVSKSQLLLQIVLRGSSDADTRTHAPFLRGFAQAFCDPVDLIRTAFFDSNGPMERFTTLRYAGAAIPSKRATYEWTGRNGTCPRNRWANPQSKQVRDLPGWQK
jgi:hypothetical protein